MEWDDRPQATLRLTVLELAQLIPLKYLADFAVTDEDYENLGEFLRRSKMELEVIVRPA